TAVGEAVPTTRYSHADGMSTEADDYVAKPIDTEGLWEVVSNLL
ncbi:MAG: response regulator, partial [Deltaproteobacteria bacterium]|nr:response regulator [Deltaproteobacteria bacterium]